jgi:hypothetical protein
MFDRSGADVKVAIFCNFCHFWGEKMAFFSKTNVTVEFLLIVAVVYVKNAHFLPNCFGENIFKIITSVPGKELSRLIEIQMSSLGA